MVKIIKQEKRNILLEHGKFVTVSLISNEDLQILRKKLYNITTEFERLFKEQLKDWKGNLDIFLPAKALVEETFEIKRFFS